MTSERVIIAPRFCGPPTSANGGYTAGLLASMIDGPCSVTLRAPPPLEKPLQRTSSEGGVVLLQDGETLIAEATPGPVEIELQKPVSLEDAKRASATYPGKHPHPYPTCFVCGPDRPRGDGLAVYPGPVDGRDVVASPWLPTRDLASDGSVVDSDFVWSALDCPSWFGYAMFHDEVPLVLLGRLAAEIKRRPRWDEPCVVIGWTLGREGRRIECGSMLFDAAHGDVLAYSKSTWVTLKVSESVK
jgi:hypothetical protein